MSRAAARELSPSHSCALAKLVTPVGRANEFDERFAGSRPLGRIGSVGKNSGREVARYEPLRLQLLLETQQNWLISEFIGSAAPLQFLDEIATEITGQNLAIPFVRGVAVIALDRGKRDHVRGKALAWIKPGFDHVGYIANILRCVNHITPLWELPRVKQKAAPNTLKITAGLRYGAVAPVGLGDEADCR